MIDLPPTYPLATQADEPALADLVDFVGEGLPSYLWARMARPGEYPRDVGIRHTSREEGAFLYRNAIVGDDGDGAITALTGYSLSEQSEPIGPDMPVMFVPVQELENLAPGNWHINVLATYPERRNRGHGARLTRFAEQLARAPGCRGPGIILPWCQSRRAPVLRESRLSSVHHLSNGEGRLEKSMAEQVAAREDE
ncbi:MAG: N-acetyltransferase [Acetobacteraceae bacterium]|nr:N-acetyltransferase [Acetobacteraceae bacterium]MSP29448.1 N-acetyltransferase [Acetobacteraceae bacterium]